MSQGLEGPYLSVGQVCSLTQPFYIFFPGPLFLLLHRDASCKKPRDTYIQLKIARGGEAVSPSPPLSAQWAAQWKSMYPSALGSAFRPPGF